MKSATVSSRAISLRQHGSNTPVTDTSVRIGSPAVRHERREVNPPHLTPRQLEVLSLLCEGLPNKLICRRLNIATGTAKVHISGIFRELGVTSRLQAVVVARRCGLLGEFVGRTPERAAASTPAAQSETASVCRACGTLHPFTAVF
jgi:DNA-binding NarL/FixJ family response regulator